MKPILPGGRGAAVEDIQRKLLTLGYDLGPTGVDGVFLGKTREAVAAFQSQHGLTEDGVVGQETWSALVDATFTLGDRVLYLRLPYFHGSDVAALQRALNILGFWCGDPDGIFGAYSEQAVREFQRSCGHAQDGIAGPDTVRALMRLRHVWEGKDIQPPLGARAERARPGDVLVRNAIAFSAMDPVAEKIAQRVVNLALATESHAQVVLTAPSDAVDGASASPWADRSVLTVYLTSAPESVSATVPLVSLDDVMGTGSVPRLATAIAASGDERTVAIETRAVSPSDERKLQRDAVDVLDAVCRSLG